VKTFEDYEEARRKVTEAHVEALAIQRKKSLIYSDKQHLEDRLVTARKEDGHRGEVYFLRESGAGYIKIGTSTNVPMRVLSIGRGTPHDLVLLATMPGAYRVEALVKMFFKSARIRGEWFRPVSDLLEYISEIETGVFLERTMTPCVMGLCRNPATHRSSLDGPICSQHTEDLRKKFPHWITELPL
jgi:hypothetical protein